MRIIAGQFRGRNLLGPADESTRPITDRVKQSLFDILTPYIEGSIIYDCFAGTGSMGLECLSRGASRVTFFEMGRSAQDRLRKNIQTLGVKDQSTIVGTDLFKWFAHSDSSRASLTASVSDAMRKDASETDAATQKSSDTRANVIFLDPPYRFLREKPQPLQELAGQFALHHLADGGIVIFRHDSADQLELSALRRYDERVYGSMTLEFLTCPS